MTTPLRQLADHAAAAQAAITAQRESAAAIAADAQAAREQAQAAIIAPASDQAPGQVAGG